MTLDDRGLEERLRRLRMPLPATVRSAVLDGQPSTARWSSRVTLGVAVGVPVLLMTLLTLTVVRTFHLPNRNPQPTGVVQALSSGAPAILHSGSDRRFVWLTGVFTPNATPQSGHAKLPTGVSVDVLDWTGALRSHFQLPQSTFPDGFNEIQAISADGTRALLTDGTVLDQTGAAVAKIPSLGRSGPGDNRARWMSDNAGVCAAVSNEPAAPQITLPPKGLASPSPLPMPPYAHPGSDHSLTLKIFGLDGSVRTVATVGSGLLGVPSGAQPDATSVIACSPSADLAVVARYHDADSVAASSGRPSTNMTVSLWAIRLSTGGTLSHVPETRLALGRQSFFGSQNGQLAVEFLWNSKVAGSETDVVLQMPAGRPVPLADVGSGSPDTPGLSADGTRILRRILNHAGDQTELELIDAGNGRVIRRVTIPGALGVTAVAEPGGSSFMVQVEGHFALVDRSGGISVLNPAVKSGEPAGVGFPPPPGLQG